MNGKGEPREPLEFQTCGKIESVTLDTFANVKVVNPARVEIEMSFTQLGRVSNDRADPECAPDKTVERIACWASIVRDLLDPAFNKADAKAVFESFDRQHFQVGQNTRSENVCLDSPCRTPCPRCRSIQYSPEEESLCRPRLE